MSRESVVKSPGLLSAPPMFERSPTIGLLLNRKPVKMSSEPVSRSAVGKLPKVSLNYSKLPQLTANTRSPCTVKLSKIAPTLEFTVTEKPTLRSPSKSDANKSTEVKVVLEAMKAKRKRCKNEDISPKNDNLQSNNKKTKRSSIDSEKKEVKKSPREEPKTAVEKVTVKTGKRPSVCLTENLSRTRKIFKNNEILSSYSSLSTPKYTPESPHLTSSTEKRAKSGTDDTPLSEIKDFSNNSCSELDSTMKTECLSDDQESRVGNVDDEKQSENEANQQSKLKKERVVYRLPDYLNSMEEYERDSIRAKDRLRSYLSAIKTVSSPRELSQQENDNALKFPKK